MEYIEQGDLMALVERQRLSEEEGKSIGQQLVEGLDIMPSNYLCHRDLKPVVIPFKPKIYRRVLTQS